MDSEIVVIFCKVRIFRARLENLDQSNINNRNISNAYREESHVDSMRILVTNSLRVKFREMMNHFQSLRDKIVEDHKEDLKRKYDCTTYELPSEKDQKDGFWDYES